MKYPTYQEAGLNASILSRKTKQKIEEVVCILTENLKALDFIVMPLFHVSDEIKSRLGIGFRKYEILETWNPELTYQAISHDSHIGLRTTCMFLIQEHENGEVEISTTNPMESASASPNSGVETIRHQLNNLLNAVLSTIQ